MSSTQLADAELARRIEDMLARNQHLLTQSVLRPRQYLRRSLSRYLSINRFDVMSAQTAEGGGGPPFTGGIRDFQLEWESGAVGGVGVDVSVRLGAFVHVHHRLVCTATREGGE